jgi:hypothetical protein
MTKKAQKSRKPADRPKRSRRVNPARPARQAASPTKTSAPKAVMKSFILFGADEYGKPRAARFAAEDPSLLAKAAEVLHVRLVEVTTPDMAALAAKLPTGRLHATGGGLIPHIKDTLYRDIFAENIRWDPVPARPAPTPQEVPASWEEIAPGNLVIAKETQECAWQEATVVERNGDFVTLQYRDYPYWPAVVRHRSAVALISLGAK